MLTWKTRIGLLLVAILCGWGRQVSSAQAPSWPRFHGPLGANLSTETGLLKSWPEGGPELVWTAQGIGAGFAGVTLADGQIYTAGNIDDNTVVTALDMDGKPRWRKACGKAWTGGPGGTRGTPTIDGARVFCESPHGDIYCLEANNGDEVWHVNILEKFGAPNITWALAESLLIDGNNVICLPGGPKASVAALDKKTGETVWAAASASGDGAGYATATLAKYQGLRIILTMTGKAFIGVDADSGELLFRHPHQTSYDVNATRPLFYNGRVFITSGYGTTGSVMLKLNVDGKKASVEKVWASRELDNHHGGVILLHESIYGAAHNFNGGKWICLDWNTGEMKYAAQGVGKGSLTFADGMLYTLSEKRDVGLVKATPEGHEVISRFETPRGPEGPTWAHPVVCGGRLYIRHGDNLYAYSVAAK